MQDRTKWQYEFFRKNYEVIAKHTVLPRQRKVVIGATLSCRYCGHDAPDVSFRAKAHALPEFIGNHAIVSRDECDTCNAYFGREVEPHLAAFLGAGRALSKIQGKRGIPTYKSRTRRSSIRASEGIFIKESGEDPFVSIDEDTKTIRLATTREPYRPIGVYKCLIKAALALLPEVELEFFEHVVKWTLQSPHQAATLRRKPICTFKTFIPGPAPIPGVRAMLLRRVTDDLPVPYLISVLAFQNYMFQTVVHTPSRDGHLDGMDVTLAYFPSTFEAGHPYGNPMRETVDLSGDDVVCGEEHPLTMRFESMEMRDPDGTIPDSKGGAGQEGRA